MIEQKRLWIELFQQPTWYDEVGFCLRALNQPSMLHNGKLPRCLEYLKTVKDEILPTAGTWRLWDEPLEVSRAKAIHAEFDQLLKDAADAKAEAKADQQRITRNINNPLDKQEQKTTETLTDKVDRELIPKENRGKRLWR